MLFPKRLKYTEDHVWLSLEGDVARIGITDYAQELLGQVRYIELPAVGSSVTCGYSFTELESAARTMEFPSPVTGEVTAVNEELDAAPDAVNDDPYGAWILEIRLEEPSELDELLSAGEYEDCCEE